jgi:hypothetical protein
VNIVAFALLLCSVTGAAVGVFTIVLLHVAMRTCWLPVELHQIPGRYPDKIYAFRKVYSFNTKSWCAFIISVIVLLVCYFKCVVVSGNNVGRILSMCSSVSFWAKVELAVTVIIAAFTLFYCSFLTWSNSVCFTKCNHVMIFRENNCCVFWESLAVHICIVWEECPCQVGPCHHGMARPQVADEGTASDMEGSCE